MGNKTLKKNKSKESIIGYLPATMDLFHIGHLRAIKKVSKKCDILLIGLLSDKAIKNYKKFYPVISYKERKEMIDNICMNIDKNVVKQDNIDMTKNLKKYNVDIAFSSDGWEPEELEAMKKCNCKAGKFPYYKKQSTTLIKKKIKDNY